MFALSYNKVSTESYIYIYMIFLVFIVEISVNIVA